MKAVLVLLVAGISGAAYAADTLPKAMLGAWASDPSACGAQASELGMTVAPNEILFYEHGFKITRTIRQKDGSFRTSGYSFDEDSRGRDTITLKLVEPDKLQVRDTIYHRCESSK